MVYFLQVRSILKDPESKCRRKFVLQWTDCYLFLNIAAYRRGRYKECHNQTELIKAAINIMLVGKADAAEDRFHEPSGRNDR